MATNRASVMEIASITDFKSNRSVYFQNIMPQIVINAAAHKHVPLMGK